MVKTSPKNNKWMRRYRTFFVIGIVILFFQIFLAARFLAISRDAEPEEDKWQPGPLSFDNESDQEIEANSAGKLKLDNTDDEDGIMVSKNKPKINQTHLLRYSELNFVPPCHISTKEAVSAINRAKTQKCKQLISNITCLSMEGKLYPSELKSSCPAEGFMSGKELGCFRDEKIFRLLSGYVGTNKKNNSPKYCINLCLQSGFPYAGVQYTSECYCGTDEPPLTSKIADSSCNMRCPGDEHETCGGFYTMNIYQTGIKRALFSNLPLMRYHPPMQGFVPQTANTEITTEINPSIKIAFLLTLNGRAVRQVKRLLKILYHKDHFYYIHVDVRQDYLYRELLVLEQMPNIRLTRKRFATIWGGASLLEMLRNCMWELINIEGWNWDFVLNLSESDFPVKPITQLIQFLNANQNKNFVKSHGREVQRFIQKQGLDKTFVECETRMWRTGDRSLPSGIQVDGGSDWVALSRSFVGYVANPEPDLLVSGLLKIFKHTLLPAESFFHTALRNSKFCNSYVDNNLHVTNWKRKLGCKCQYKQVVDWCGCSPNDFRPDDWARIQNTLSRQLFFARKFEPIINQAVILQLELWLYNLDQPCKFIPNLLGYWQSEYHHLDLGGHFNDGLLTLGNSVKRYMLNVFSRNNSCKLDLGDLIQVNLFHYNDTYRFSLFHFKFWKKENLEVAVKPINYVNVSKKSPLMERLTLLVVSSDYDQKEQVSRNFLRILSPQSEPTLIYRFLPKYGSQTYNLTSLWISPTGHLFDIVEFAVEESSLIGHVKPYLRPPLLPGNWTVKLIYKNSLLAEVKFLIIPLEFFSGISVKQSQVSILNGGSNNSKNMKTYEKFLPSESEKNHLTEVATMNSKKFGKDLEMWIDELFLMFYSIQKMCVTSIDTIDVCSVKVSACVKTNWSSFAPDPKSAIGEVNQTTGTFNIW